MKLGHCGLIQLLLPNQQHPAVNCHPLYLLGEVSSIIMTVVYIPHQAYVQLSLEELRALDNKHWTAYTDSTSIIAGDFDMANLKKNTSKLPQHVSCITRGSNTSDHCYYLAHTIGKLET